VVDSRYITAKPAVLACFLLVEEEQAKKISIKRGAGRRMLVKKDRESSMLGPQMACL
jgi:hypothetical protein